MFPVSPDAEKTMHEPLNAPFRSDNQLTAVRAELSGDTRCSALSIFVRANAPVLVLCRKLVEAGHDATLALEAYRDETRSLYVRAIGEAAGLEINAKGTGFIPLRAVRTASPIEAISQEAIR
jgi:hypothetical protein